MEMELVPPGCHQHNAEEVAIHNSKSHFLSVLAGVADDSPLYLCDRLLPQTEITINLLRQSNATPTVSAYVHLSRPFDYNTMPLAPMGCAAQIHESTDKHGTWAFHSVDGWYLSTSAKHYRTPTCYAKETKSERLTKTVQLSHKSITNPTINHAAKIMAAIADCAKSIKGIGNGGGDGGMAQFNQLVSLTKKAVQHDPTLFTQQGHKEPQLILRAPSDTADNDMHR